MEFRKIASDHIGEYRNEVLKSSSASTFDRKMFSLKKFFEWAVKEGYMDGNPVEEFLKAEDEIVETKLGKIEKQKRENPPSYGSTQARIIARLAGKPKLQKLAYNLFYTRPKWYRSYHSLPIATYFNYAILILLMSSLGFGVYNQFFKTTSSPLAYPTTLTRAGRYLSFQGRLTNNLSNPITTSTNLVFKLYNVSTGGAALWNSSTCAITPDTDGIFSTLLGSSCGAEIPASVFSENSAIWLGVTVGVDAEATPRVQIATVAYALNSETLQGYPASESATANTVPVMNSLGQIVLAASSPKMQSTSGTFAIEGQALTITTPDTSNGSIAINPDGTGTLNLIFEGAAPGGSAGGFVNATNANITSGALYFGQVASNATGYNLLQLKSGATPTNKFVVDYAGNVTAGTVNGLTISSGTISGGTWNGTAIGTQYGGTGQNWSSVAQGSVPYFNGTGTMTTLAPGTSGYVLTTQGASANPTWTAASGLGTNYWALGTGTIYPGNTTLDLLLGASATTSAKFAFTGVNSGTPTASISGTTTNVTTYLDGNGNLSTTNAQDLTLGSTYTGNVIINSRGNAALTANGANLTTTGTFTLPNTNTLTGVASYLRLSQGISVGGADTYHIDSSGNGVFNALSATSYATVSASLALGNTTAAAGPGHLNMSGNLTFGGALMPGGSAGTSGQFLTSAGAGATPTWTSTVPASSVPFSGITSGTNTTAAMVVGAGASLNYTSTGTINASSLLGGTWIAPGTIGSGTPNTGAFTTLSATTLSASSYATISGSLALGSSTAAAGPGNLSMSGNFLAGGTINGLNITSGTITNAAWNGTAISTTYGGTGANNSTAAQYSVPYYSATGVMGGILVPGTAGYVLSTNSTGSAPSWIPVSATGTNYWALGTGTIYPGNTTLDLLLGANATTSAKFAFKNVLTGTPTASISGSTANVALFMDGDGNISTTNRANLVLGNSATYNTTGNILLNPNGTGLVGIGTTLPSGTLHVSNGASGVSAASVADNIVVESNDQTGISLLSPNGSYSQIFWGSPGDFGSGARTRWLQSAGLFEIGSDVAGGQVSIKSGDFADAIRIDSTGKVGIGTTSPVVSLDVAGAASISGSLTFRAGTGSIQTTAFNPLTIGGLTTGNITLNPSNAAAGGYVVPNTTNVTDLGTASTLWRNVYGTTIYQGANQVCDVSGNCGAVGNYWGQALGALYPVNNSVDLLIGSTATTSAKFAFKNVLTGVPTASISGTTANVATFIDGNGNISTTNRQNLVLGNSATYDSTGNILLNPNGTGYVGIGYTTPASALDIAGGAVATQGTNQVTNGTFDADTNWIKGIGWTIGTGVATKTAGTASNLSQDTGEAAGKMYYISFTFTRTAGTLQVAIGGVTYANSFINSGSQSAYVYSTGTGDLTFIADAAFAGTVDNVNVQEVSSSLANSTFRDSAGTLKSELRIAGTGNTFLGRGSGKFNVNGIYNAALGTDALTNLTSGIYNTAVGEYALYSNTTGGYNTALGEGSLWSNTTGENNTAIGVEALANNTSGGYNVGIGRNALNTMTGDHYYNTSIGYWSSESLIGDGNTALGTSALGYTSTAIANFNTAIGYSTLKSIQGGSNNTALGYNAGDALTTGNSNIIIGYNIDLPTVSSSNMLDIGNLIYATGIDGTGTTISTGNVGIGTASPATKLDVAGSITASGVLNAGGITAAAYNAFAGVSDTPSSTAITTTNDLFVGGDTELKGGLYLAGKNIFNVVGGVSTGTITLATDPTLINNYNALSYGSWLVNNSTNNGIAALMVNQSKGGDIFTASASGSPKFVIDNSGNVGIGITAPITHLTLSGNAVGATEIALAANANTGRTTYLTGDYALVGTSATAGGTYPFNEAGNLIIQSRAATAGRDIVFATGTSPTTRMVVDRNGDVGIGTTDPLSKLDVGGATYIKVGDATAGLSGTPEGLHMDYQASDPDIGPAIRWTDGTLTNTFGLFVNSGINFQGNASNPDFILRTPTTDGTLGTAVINLGSASTADTTYFNAGNFGIGLTNPVHKLEVVQSATTNAYAAINGLNNGVNVGTAYGVIGQSTGASVTNVGGYFNATGATNNYGLIVPNGNVGIGTTGPTEKLVVSNGAIMINSASTVDNDGRGITLNSDDDFLYDGEYIPQYSFGFHSFGGGSNAYVSGWGGIDMFTGGSPRLRIDASSGNVGIGTTSPGSATKLQVNGKGLFTGGTADSGDGTSAGTHIGYNTASDYGFIRAVQTGIASKNLVLQEGGGNVGIGTASPDTKLEVNGYADSASALTLDVATAKYFVEFDRNGTKVADIYKNTSGALTFESFAAGSTTADFLFSGGNVGVNVTSSLGYLNVLSSEAIIGTGASQNPLRMIAHSNTPITNGVGLRSSDPNVSGWNLNVDSWSAVVFNADTDNNEGGGATSEKMRITPLGRVGIGTGTPSVNLHVNGATTYSVTGPFSGATANAVWNTGFATQNISTSILANGALVANGVFSASDQRLKENINLINPELVNAFLQNVRPVNFNWKEGGLFDTGFIAQEFIRDGFGYLVKATPDDSVEQYIDQDGFISPAGFQYNIDYQAIVPILTFALQQQQTQIASLSAQLADISLTSTGDLDISTDSNGNYQVTDTSSGTVITKVGAFTQAVIANIKAGAVVTEELATDSLTAFQATVDNMLVKSGLVSPVVQTALISPLPGDTDVTVQIGSGDTPSGQFAVQNTEGVDIATIDNQGNATFSGTLYADNINSKSLDEIQALLTKVQTDQTLLAQASTWDITATNSASLDNIAVADLYVTNQAAINSLSVTDSLAIGSDLIFQSQDSSLNTLTSPLRIQSLAMAPVEIMAGLIKIDTLGNVVISGNLAVGGRVSSGGLTLKNLPTQDMIFNVEDVAGSPVATIDASGSASFKGLTTEGLTIAGAIDATNSASVNGVITTNATAGSGVVLGGVSEITIRNINVTDYTLVYVTPTSSTNNYVLYVKSKTPGEFVVGFTDPIGIDVNFNWWIVRVAQ